MTITAADVKVTPVAAPKITGVTWTATSVTITFDGNATAAASGLAKKSVADNTNVTINEPTQTSGRSVTYSITGGVLQAGDTLTLDLSKFTDTDYSGQVTATPANANTVTLNSDGTGALSYV